MTRARPGTIIPHTPQPFAKGAAPGQSPAAPTTSRLIALEGLRFVAMFHLFLFHRFPVASNELPGWFNAIRLNAHYSTSIFFILSGFILAYVYTSPERGLKLKDSDFWSRRFWRIYPIHVIASTAYLPLYLIGTKSYSIGEVLPTLIPNLLLVHAWIPDFPEPIFNIVSWSISVLAFWYAFFPALARRFSTAPAARIVRAMVVAWASYLVPPMLYLAFGLGESEHGMLFRHLLYTNPLLRFPEFIIGVLTGLLFLRRRSPFPAWLEPAAILANVLALISCTFLPWALTHNGIFTPLQALLIAVVAAGTGPFARVFSWKPLQILGASSLTFYFLNMPLYEYIGRILWVGIILVGYQPDSAAAFRTLFATQPDSLEQQEILYVISAILTYAAAAVIHYRVFEPVTKKLQKINVFGWTGR
jgi:peptidoglycan/LPS O-acetylase OafA/YrhL